MKMEDDRTPEQLKTHQLLIIGTDSFMSGWGAAENGVSYAAWACHYDDADKVRRWVESRGEMKRVRETVDPTYDGKRYRPSGRGHCHIYVVDEGHPALG